MKSIGTIIKALFFKQALDNLTTPAQPPAAPVAVPADATKTVTVAVGKELIRQSTQPELDFSPSPRRPRSRTDVLERYARGIGRINDELTLGSWRKDFDPTKFSIELGIDTRFVWALIQLGAVVRKGHRGSYEYAKTTKLFQITGAEVRARIVEYDQFIRKQKAGETNP